MDSPDTAWCILRTAPGSTIALAKAMNDAGILAWTPIRTTTRNALLTEDGKDPLPGLRGNIPITVPMVSMIVFAAYDRLPDLLEMAASPGLHYKTWDPEERRMVMRGRPYFTVFHMDGEIPRVPDRQLDALRKAEIEKARKVKRKRGARKPGHRRFELGEAVRVPDGPFAGLDGVIVPAQSNGLVRVSFGSGGFEVEFDPWLVHSIDVKGEQPSPGTAAKAA